MFFFPEETMLKDQTADFVSSLAALLSTTRDQRQPAEGEGAVVPILLESQLGFTQGLQKSQIKCSNSKVYGRSARHLAMICRHQFLSIFTRAMSGLCWVFEGDSFGNFDSFDSVTSVADPRHCSISNRKHCSFRSFRSFCREQAGNAS